MMILLFEDVVFGKEIMIEIFCEEMCDICKGLGVKFGINLEMCLYCGGFG